MRFHVAPVIVGTAVLSNVASAATYIPILSPLLSPLAPLLGALTPSNLLNSLNSGAAQVTQSLLNTQSSVLALEAAMLAPIFANSTVGTIAVSGTSTGYLGLCTTCTGAYQAIYQIVSDVSQATNIYVPNSRCLALPSPFGMVGPLSDTYKMLPWVGLGSFDGKGDYYDYTLSTSTAGYGFILPTNSSTASTFATAATSLGTGIGGESQVWSMNCVNHVLSATWTAADGSAVPVSFVEYSKGVIIPVGNLATFNSKFQSSQYDVSGQALTLTFQPTNNALF
ncbi:hypothetical protein T439DRAFT_380711 [Meredithblackwellia eburnea MCA 4105]